MNHQHNPQRRGFLKLSAGLASLGAMSLGFGLGVREARASQVNDYKALICVYLFGGNDGNNVIVPLDSTRYGQYQAIRGNLAMSPTSGIKEQKLSTPITDIGGNPYALHGGLNEMTALYNSGQLAVVLNTGMLERPINLLQYQQGTYNPSNLFSHADQTVQVQTGQPTAIGTGWGGRLLDQLGGGADTLAAVSVSSPSLLLQGGQVTGNVVTPGTNLNLSGMDMWDQNVQLARRQAMAQLLGFDNGNAVRQAANKSFSDGLALANAMKTNANLNPLNTVIAGGELGNQLQEIVRLIRLRSQQGPGRQVFFCSLGGFDTHSSQSWQHWDLLSKLSQGLNAFYESMQEIGLAQKVTVFTQSEFGRTLQSNGGGSDHAWGNHQLVLGGAVKGGIYGQMPQFVLNGPDDANGRGVWIPKISTAQFGATLGRWFGASDAELAQVFPNLGLFPSSDVGFML